MIFQEQHPIIWENTGNFANLAADGGSRWIKGLDILGILVQIP